MQAHRRGFLLYVMRQFGVPLFKISKSTKNYLKSLKNYLKNLKNYLKNRKTYLPQTLNPKPLKNMKNLILIWILRMKESFSFLKAENAEQ